MRDPNQIQADLREAFERGAQAQRRFYFMFYDAIPDRSNVAKIKERAHRIYPDIPNKNESKPKTKRYKYKILYGSDLDGEVELTEIEYKDKDGSTSIRKCHPNNEEILIKGQSYESCQRDYADMLIRW